MNPKTSAIYKESVLQLAHIYGEREADSIMNLVFDDHLNVSRIQRLTTPELELTEDQLTRLQDALERLLKQEPVQHIIGQTYFAGHCFMVSEHTLIPRPETEELVALILKANKGRAGLSVLDIGTGSGCIAIALGLQLKAAQVVGWDISADALTVASKNAINLDIDASFELKNVLVDCPNRKFDIIVSNPPYIPEKERHGMAGNVLSYEPEMALFVPDDDPLLFYKSIGQMALQFLKPGGQLYFEIHESYGNELTELLDQMGFISVRMVQDLNGKDRMISVIRP